MHCCAMALSSNKTPWRIVAPVSTLSVVSPGPNDLFVWALGAFVWTVPVYNEWIPGSKFPTFTHALYWTHASAALLLAHIGSLVTWSMWLLAVVAAIYSPLYSSVSVLGLRWLTG